MDFTTKDSGQRQEFDTGSRRDTREGKGRFDLLPLDGIKRLAQLYERGAVKYGDRNWEKGQPLARYADSMLRHAFQAAAGHTDEDHWAAVAWNALAVIDHQERIARGELPVELDDLPHPDGPKLAQEILAALAGVPLPPQMKPPGTVRRGGYMPVPQQSNGQTTVYDFVDSEPANNCGGRLHGVGEFHD